MKNFYFLLVISFLMVQNIFAQEEAFSKSSLSLGNLLYDVNFISSQSGWAVGAGGTIMHTNDGGINWTMQLSGTTNRLWGVSFTDENNGIVVGWEGTILKTTNGGLNWTYNKVELQKIYWVYSLQMQIMALQLASMGKFLGQQMEE